MDNSTENVTLLAAFVSDVLKNYQDKKNEYMELFSYADGYDLSNPMNHVPIAVYNDMCYWLESKLGKFNLIKVGRTIGETVYITMLTNKMFADRPSPHEIIRALVVVASNAIHDPKKRGWVILEEADKSILMRKTQTFNTKLQLGLLDGLIRKSGAAGVNVDLVKDVENGAEFDEFLITWVTA
jgi:hypothetical protein